ncbi:MAG: YqeG family HAD IIIA-type phosphatase [Candidatus Obscuribacterales bacterium]|nr:YqeG family HAD IIIA-type phosphatase [Candidatus Obscuribacterales bacterium]
MTKMNLSFYTGRRLEVAFKIVGNVEEFKKVHKPHLSFMVILRPTYLINGDVTDIDLERLRADGIAGLIFDLDSTLIAPRSGVLSDEVAAWLKFARLHFKIAIVSNNKKEPYLKKAQEVLEMPVIGYAAKPSRQAFFKVLKEFGLEASQIAVIGDRPLTDVLGGHRAGMKTVLVWPLKTQVEPRWIKMFRRLERCVIRS